MNVNAFSKKNRALSVTNVRALTRPNIPKKNFRGPLYVADLGGPPLVRKKNNKIYNIGQLFEGKKINFAVLSFKNMFFKFFK